MIVIDLSKQQALDVDQQQISFTGNVDQVAGATIFFITEKAKETDFVLDFSQEIAKVF